MPALASATTSVNLVLAAGALLGASPSSRFAFALRATDALGQAVEANATLALNAPPANGTFSAAPAAGGVALATSFLLACAGWADPDGADELAASLPRRHSYARRG